MKKLFTILAILALCCSSSVAVACSPVETVAMETQKEYSRIKTPARYGTGELQLMRDISQAIKYPKDCIEQEIQGVVVVNFTVSRKGKVGGFKLIKSLHPSADAEAIRVLKQLPGKWKPALDNKGKPISSSITLPLTFSIQ